MKSTKRLISIMAATLLTASLFAGCGNKAATNNGAKEEVKTEVKAEGKIKIGFAMDTLKEERWQRDRDLFKAKVESLGAECLVQACQGDDALQVSQAENLISQGVNLLVVVPHNAGAASTIVEMAHAANIPVISYDRLITDADVDLYISFDNVKVGELQAKYITGLVPKGNYAYIGGAPTDNNATLFRQGAMNIIQPLIDKGDIKLVTDQMSDDWKPEKAQANMENALTKNSNAIDAVVCANDGTAGGAIQALAEQKMDGKIPVSGQDAELAACMRIVEGKQAMTIYKPVKPLAEKAAQIAVEWANGTKPVADQKINNKKIDVPSILLEPVQVDKNNMKETVIADGWHKEEDVYKNVK